MSIYKRKSGRYTVLVDLDPDADGRRQRQSLGTFANKKLAEKAERQALEARDRGENLAREAITVTELWEKFEADARIRLTPNTHNRYCELWRCHIKDAIGAIDARKLRPSQLQELYASLAQKKGRKGALSTRTIHHAHRLLHAMLAWAERLDILATNVARRVKPPRPNQSPARALSTDEALALLDAAADDRYHPFFVVALSTGMRRGEIMGLQWDAIDFDRGLATVRASIASDRAGGYIVKGTKTNRVRVVPLGSEALDALRSVKVRQAAEKLAAQSDEYFDGGFVFGNTHGILELDAPTKAFAAAARRAKIGGVTLHSLRHTTATIALSEGSDVRTVAALLGHASPTLTLNTYGHVVTGAQERAVGLVAGALSLAQARRAASANGRG